MLDALLDRLQDQCPSFEVIAAAPSGAAIATVAAAAASAALKTLLESAVGAAYFVEFPEGAEPPDAAYSLVSARPLDDDGRSVLTTVGFVVTLRAISPHALVQAIAAVEAGVIASADAISITDAAFDFDAPRRHYLANLELSFAVPAVTGGSNWPCLLVWVDSIEGMPSAYDNIIRQRINRTYNLTLITSGNDIESLRAEVQTALLGWQQAAPDVEFQFVAGGHLALPGGLAAWRDQYADGAFISQA